MALNGTIWGTCYTYNGTVTNKYEFKVEWSATQDYVANTSYITAKSYLRSTSASTTTQSSMWSSKINNSQVWSGSGRVGSSWFGMGQRSWTVNHNNDGTCRTNIKAEVTNGIQYHDIYVIKRAYASADIELNTIPRAANFTLSKDSVYFGEEVVMTINKLGGNFDYQPQYRFGDISFWDGYVTDRWYLTPSRDDMNQIPNSTVGTATVILHTKKGDQVIGSQSKSLTLKVPEDVVPTIGDLKIEGRRLLKDYFVAGKSSFRAEIVNASGVYGSQISSYNLSGAGLNSNSQSASSGELSEGTYQIKAKVTDSRGRSATKTKEIVVHSYYPPTLQANVYRCNSDGSSNDEGIYVNIELMPNILNVAGANINDKKFKVEYRKVVDTDFKTKINWTDLESYTDKKIVSLGGGFDNSTSFVFKISIKDSYSTVELLASVSTMECISNFEKKGVGVRKPYERGALDIYGSIYSNESLTLGDNEEHGLYTIAGKHLIKNNVHGGVDVGDERFGTVLCGNDVLKFWDGNEAYSVFTEKNPPSAEQSGAMSRNFPEFKGNMTQICGGDERKKWFYHINADTGYLYFAPFKYNSNEIDWSKQIVFTTSGNLECRDIYMKSTWIYECQRMQSRNTAIDLEGKNGVGINGGPLWLNGNDMIKSAAYVDEYAVKRCNDRISVDNLLDEYMPVQTEKGLRLIKKFTSITDEGAENVVDYGDIISALVIKVSELSKKINNFEGEKNDRITIKHR